MTMSSNLMSLPFRKTTSQTLSTAIKQNILSNYNQHPDMFNDDFTLIDSLRQNAVQVSEPNLAGVKRITTYACQLVWIMGKFPVDIGVEFVWYPAFGYNRERPIVLNSLRYELASVLYNLAALYSQLAISSNRSTSGGLKLASNHLCLAAGVTKYVKENIIPEMELPPSDDLNDSALECLQQILLAQAQECFWQKAVMDGYRDSSIAKLAAQTSYFYGLAADWGVKSETINPEWIHFAMAKNCHFSAAAQYRQARDCLEKKKYGEEVARLSYSITCLQEGLKEAKYLNRLVMGDLNSLKTKVFGDLRRAEKDNDIIYLCPVPPRSELVSIEGAAMAASKIPLEISEPLSFLGDGGDFGRPLFEKLVPFAVHVAASIFEQRLDRVVNESIVLPLEALNTKIHTILSSLSLPGSLQALEKPLGLPPALSSHAEEIRQSNGVDRLQRSFSEISELAKSANSIYDEAKSHLIAERNEDERLRSKYGLDCLKRLDSALAAPKLYGQLDEIDGYLKSAAKSDNLIHGKYLECKNMLHILSSGSLSINNFLPSACRMTLSTELDKQASELRKILNNLAKLETDRRKKIEDIRERVKKDDINPSLLDETARLEQTYPAQRLTPAHFEDLLETRVSAYDADIFGIKNDEDEQNRLIRKLEICHKEFIHARNREGNSDSKERARALQDLEDAYFQYKEIIRNLESARKFYNDLGKMVGRFRDESRSWVLERGKEATRLESELGCRAVARSPEFACQQSQQKEPTKKHAPSSPPIQFVHQHNSSPSSPSASATDDTAPLAAGPLGKGPAVITSIWEPKLGIRFSATSESAFGSRIVSQTRESGRDPAVTHSTANLPKNAGKGEDNTWDPNKGLRFGS